MADVYVYNYYNKWFKSRESLEGGSDQHHVGGTDACTRSNKKARFSLRVFRLSMSHRGKQDNRLVVVLKNIGDHGGV